MIYETICCLACLALWMQDSFRKYRILFRLREQGSRGVNDNTLYPLESLGECFGDDIVCAVDIGVDQRAIGGPEQTAPDPPSGIPRPFLGRLSIQEAAFRSVAFLLTETWMPASCAL
jgi:hypothetical protein